MPPKIATSVVETGPFDDLVAVDAYAATPEVTEEKLANEPEAINEGLAGLKDISVSPADLTKIIMFDKGSPGIDSNKLSDVAKTNAIAAILNNGEAGKRIDQAAGQNLNSIPGLDKNTKVVAETLMPGILENETLQMADTAGGWIKIGKDADLSSATGITKAIKKLTKDSAIGDFIDNNAELGIAMSYLDEAVKLGIPSMIDALIKKYRDDKRFIERLINSTRSVIMRSDIDSLNIILDEVGSEGVLSRVPDACTLLLSAYRYPRKTEPKEYPDKRTQLLTVLNRIDPLWDTLPRAGVTTSALQPFFRISKQASELLLMEPGYDVPIMIAKSYPPVDLGSLARRCFPRMRAW